MEKQKLFFLYSEKSIGGKNKPISLWCACACMSTCQFTYRQEKKDHSQSEQCVKKKKLSDCRLIHPYLQALHMCCRNSWRTQSTNGSDRPLPCTPAPPCVWFKSLPRRILFLQNYNLVLILSKTKCGVRKCISGSRRHFLSRRFGVYSHHNGPARIPELQI